MDKKKVHIALVGGQTMPVYLGITEMRPDEVILVHSSGTKSQAKQISEEYSEITSLIEFPPVGMEEIDHKVNELLESKKDTQVSINLTSGIKTWTIAFAMQAQAWRNVSLIYVDQNCVFYNYTDGNEWNATQILDTDTLIKYNGQVPKQRSLLSDYTAEDLKVLQKVKNLRKTNFKDFNDITIPNKKNWGNRFNGNEGEFESSGSRIEWKKSTHHVKISLVNDLHKFEEAFDSPHSIQIVFNSGWFEYEVAKKLSRWSHAHDVWMNVVYPSRQGNAKNEIDIVVNTGIKLLMVECKTQIHNVTDIDKFHTAVRNYGGMGCKSLFVTEAKMSDIAKEKCHDNSIATFSIKEHANPQNELFKLLDKELLGINPK